MLYFPSGNAVFFAIPSSPALRLVGASHILRETSPGSGFLILSERYPHRGKKLAAEAEFKAMSLVWPSLRKHPLCFSEDFPEELS